MNGEYRYIECNGTFHLGNAQNIFLVHYSKGQVINIFNATTMFSSAPYDTHPGDVYVFTHTIILKLKYFMVNNVASY